MAKGTYDPNETPEQLAARLVTIKKFVDSVNPPEINTTAGAPADACVICPGCLYQFVAIPVKTQVQLAELGEMYGALSVECERLRQSIEGKDEHIHALEEHLARAHDKISEYAKAINGILGDEVQRH